MRILLCLFLAVPVYAFTQISVPERSADWDEEQVGTIYKVKKELFKGSPQKITAALYRFSDTLIFSSKVKTIFYFEFLSKVEALSINKLKIEPAKATFNSPPIAADTFIIHLSSNRATAPQVASVELGIIPLKENNNLRAKKRFGAAGNCLINVNCSEGAAWESQKRSVVKIHSRVLGRLYECSGVLVNNTLENNAPYVLTAEHCAHISRTDTYSTPDDLDKWNFYFNYESTNCLTPNSENDINYGLMTGANFVAQSEDRGGDYGSDFYLVALQDTIPENYHAYLAGWYSENLAAENGVSIHHPSFDLKKISTFNQPTRSDASIEGTPDAHWRVQWATTQHGLSITEGGSSGAPLFNQDGLLIGTLNGGESSCNNLEGDDWFGKLAYSWSSNGTKATQQLRNYLAPNSTVTSLQGKEYEQTINPPQPTLTPPLLNRVYPNPVRALLNIEGEDFEEASLYTFSGNYIATFTSTPISLENLAKGSYLLLVTYKTQQKTYRISTL